MNEILKRLEIIKNSIAIEDEEIIELQVMKLQKMDIDEEVKIILTLLEKNEYGTALVALEEYIKRYSTLTVYVDLEVQGLKLELKSLEAKLQKFIELKTEILNTTEEFNREYTIKIGHLIEEILALKKDIFHKKTLAKEKLKKQYQEEKKNNEEIKNTIDEIEENIEELEEVLEQLDEESPEYEEYSRIYEDLKDTKEKLEEELKQQEKELKDIEDKIDEDENIEEEYEEAKNSYEDYHQEYEEIKEQQENINSLNDEEKKELKKLYKKAAKLCHPDIVTDEHKEQAQEIMKELNDAYTKQDLNKIKTILESLENGTGFKVSSDAIDDVEILKAKIEEIKIKINQVQSEIEEIKKDETYLILSEVDEWDVYFEKLKEELQKEKERLEEEAKEILKDI